MLSQSIEALLDPIETATRDGRLSWKQDVGESYKVNISQYEVNVGRYIDQKDDSWVSYVRLKKGRIIIDEIIATEYDSEYRRLYSLFSEARRSAHEVNTVIPEILDALKSFSPKLSET